MAKNSARIYAEVAEAVRDEFIIAARRRKTSGKAVLEAFVHQYVAGEVASDVGIHTPSSTTEISPPGPLSAEVQNLTIILRSGDRSAIRAVKALLAEFGEKDEGVEVAEQERADIARALGDAERVADQARRVIEDGGKAGGEGDRRVKRRGGR